MDGNNSKSNLINLTAREHFIVHQLLAKIHRGNRSLCIAAFMMSNFKIYGSKKYAWLKENLNKIPVSEETRVKISVTQINRSPEEEKKEIQRKRLETRKKNKILKLN